MEDRVKIAIDFLKEGQSFKIGNLRLGMDDINNMYVTGWSKYYDVENLTKQIALEELEDIKKLFQEVVNCSSDLKDFIKDKIIEFNLAIEYGQGSIGICSEKEGILIWHIELIGSNV